MKPEMLYLSMFPFSSWEHTLYPLGIHRNTIGLVNGGNYNIDEGDALLYLS